MGGGVNGARQPPYDGPELSPVILEQLKPRKMFTFAQKWQKLLRVMAAGHRNLAAQGEVECQKSSLFAWGDTTNG